MGTQVPKWLGLGVMIVGVPMVLMDAASVSGELNELDKNSSTREARFDNCIAKTSGFGVHPKKQVEMCNCIVDKSEARGVTGKYGSYDEEGLEAVVKSCSWEVGL